MDALAQMRRALAGSHTIGAVRLARADAAHPDPVSRRQMARAVEIARGLLWRPVVADRRGPERYRVRAERSACRRPCRGRTPPRTTAPCSNLARDHPPPRLTGRHADRRSAQGTDHPDPGAGHRLGRESSGEWLAAGDGPSGDQFSELTTNANPGVSSLLLPVPTGGALPSSTAVVTGEELVDARPDVDRNAYRRRLLRFSQVAPRAFSDITANNIGRHARIVLDNLISGPADRCPFRAVRASSPAASGRRSTNLSVLPLLCRALLPARWSSLEE
ncbi:MAG: hypothetical protein R3D53_08935 [Paracoccaceae bacterium]